MQIDTPICRTDQLFATCGDRAAANIQVQGFSICVTDPNASLIWSQVSIGLQMVHAATLCILAIIQCVRQSLQMHRATQRWQLNRYMSLLGKQGILYFIVYVPIPSLLLLPSLPANSSLC